MSDISLSQNDTAPATSAAASSSSRATQALAFYEHFQQCGTVIEQEIKAAQQVTQLTLPLSKLSHLRAEVTDAYPYLPTYDRNTYESKLRTLASSITTRRAEMTKNTKFAFRRPSREEVDAWYKTRREEREKKVQLLQAQRVQNVAEKVKDAEQSGAIGQTRVSQKGYTFASQKGRKLFRSDKEIFPPLASSSTSLSGKNAGDVTAVDLHIRDVECCVIDLRPVSSRLRRGESLQGDRGKGKAKASDDDDDQDAAASAAKSSQKQEEESSDSGDFEIRAVQIRNVRDSILILDDIKGSVMIHDMQRCFVAVACRQYRMHDSNDSICLISTDSIITLEGCRNIALAPYLHDKNDDAEASKHLQVQDFDHISHLTASPNYHLLPSSSSPQDGQGKQDGQDVQAEIRRALLSTSTESEDDAESANPLLDKQISALREFIRRALEQKRIP